MSTTEDSPAVDGAVELPDAVSASADPVLLGGNELVADSLGEYISAQWKKIRTGDSGVLPVVIGLIALIIIFQSKNGKFLSAGNLVNLVDQGGYLIVLGMAEIFVLLLGEIDLSAGFNMGVGAIVTAELAAPPHNVAWGLAVLAGVASCVVISTIEGLLITRLRLPSFIVTLAFFLGLQGVILTLFSHDKHSSGGNINLNNQVLIDVVNGRLTPTAGWIVMGVGVALFAAFSIIRDRSRRNSGLVAPPFSLVLIKIFAVLVAGVLVVFECNRNRGHFIVVVKGVPWVIPIILVLLMAVTFLLNRTRFGRYIYAIGGNAEAARRAGISVNRIRLMAFMLTGVMAGIAGVLYESQLGSISSNIDGGTYVLYAVAAAVIGGTSLVGGRGRMIHAVLGGIIIAAIANGMGLIGLSAASQHIVNALVLLAAVTVDAIARRGRTAGGT